LKGKLSRRERYPKMTRKKHAAGKWTRRTGIKEKGLDLGKPQSSKERKDEDSKRREEKR